MSETQTSDVSREGIGQYDFTTLILLAGITAVLFAGGLALTEFTEIPPDIDFKPFFIVYAIIVLVPWGTPTLAVAFGAAGAEGILDLIEGAAADDPFGWVGYLIGFTLFGWLIKDDTSNYLKISIAAVLAAFVQIFIEALNVIIISNKAISIFATIVIANTITHGVIMGAILLIPTLEALEGRVDRMFGSVAQN
ncbi:MAG: hypothetical protein ABEI06_05340 [Halobacteriaceae archaeon]